MKQRGSALIIAMMLIATVGAAAFGIARLLYVDTSISTTYENGTFAYYAAESGMEEGFLRYKYNMNAEVPYASWALNGTNVFRTNLTDNTIDSASGVGISGATIVTELAKQKYDLSMGYLGTYDNASKTYRPSFDHFITTPRPNLNDVFDPSFDTGDYSFLKIPKDEARKFDLSNVDFTANRLGVGFKFLDVKADGGFTPQTECKAMAEVKFLITSSSGISKEYKALTSFNPDKCSEVIGIEAGKMDGARNIFANGGNTSLAGHITTQTPDIGYYYNYENLLGQVLTKAGATPPSYPNDKVTMTIKPLYYDADVYFYAQNLANSSFYSVAGPYTYIKATGYYGGVTRTLKANIDRQSGTLYDLYDYVLFKGN